MAADGRVKRLRPGDEVTTYCGRCRQERTHQIVALNSEGQPDRVLCRFCQSDHLYRRNRSAAQGSAKTGPPAPGAATLRPYSAKETYSVGDVILHMKFGQGRVVEAREGKIVVKFGAETRTLLHAG